MLIRQAIATAFIAGLVAGPAFAADKPAALKICYDAEENYPWLMKDRPGLNIIHLQAVEKKVGAKFDMAPVPWKRCLDELKAGNYDGAFAASFKADRLEMGNYPMKAGKVDDSRMLMLNSYSLYRAKGSTALQWDGTKLAAAGSIGAQSGYSIIDQLKTLGARVDDGTKSADDNLKKLLLGRVDAVALLTQEGDNSVAKNPDFAAKIEKVSPPLVEKAYFIMLSKQFTAKYGAFAEEIWNTIAEVRESADYKAKVASFK